jgi:hypothetical protein
MGLFLHSSMHARWPSRASIISYPIDYTVTYTYLHSLILPLIQKYLLVNL